MKKKATSNGHPDTPKKKAKKTGRPTKYRPLPPEKIIGAMVSLGARHKEIARLFGCTVDQVRCWKKRHPELSRAFKKDAPDADARVEESLYQQALKGNIAAIIFYLKNKLPMRWRDRREAWSGALDVNTTDTQRTEQDVNVKLELASLPTAELLRRLAPHVRAELADPYEGLKNAKPEEPE